MPEDVATACGIPADKNPIPAALARFDQTGERTAILVFTGHAPVHIKFELISVVDPLTDTKLPLAEFDELRQRILQQKPPEADVDDWLVDFILQAAYGMHKANSEIDRKMFAFLFHEVPGASVVVCRYDAVPGCASVDLTECVFGARGVRTLH
jgi:hypothetical protein